LANEHQHIAKRQLRVTKKDHLGKRLGSCLTGPQDRRLSEPWCPEKRQQLLSSFYTAAQRL
jgi:hypothetical protein